MNKLLCAILDDSIPAIYLDHKSAGAKCVSTTTTIQRRGAICIIVNNPDEDSHCSDNNVDNIGENNSDDFDVGNVSDIECSATEIRVQVQPTKLQFWHNLMMVTRRQQRRKSKKKSRKKSKSNSKPYKCQTNYPKTSRKSNNKNGKFTNRFIDYFHHRNSRDIHQKKNFGKVSLVHFHTTIATKSTTIKQKKISTTS